MHRLIVTLCLLSRVYSAMTIQRHIYSHQISRLARSESPPSLTEHRFNKFGEKPGTFGIFANADRIKSKTDDKLRIHSPLETHEIKFVTESYMNHDFTPITQYDYNYKMPRNIEHINKYSSADVNTGIAMDRLKYPSKMNDAFYGYDTDFHIDDDDVRTSGRTYDNYASFFYHNPYEYDHKSVDMDKAKDKRYADSSEKVIPVHEHIENDTYLTPYEASTMSNDNNPIGGNEPFFSFVLNDYFDRNHVEDSLTFKGLGVDWGKDFDHESYRPAEETRRDRGLENYFTPVVQWITTERSNGISNANDVFTNTPDGTLDQFVAERGENYNSDNYDINNKKHATHRKNGGVGERKYEGFKDFLDSFANKFGLSDNIGDTNYVNEMNKDKGEKKKGFHRVYHKDEFLEDKEFFDHSNKSAKASDKGASKFHTGGSEAILRSQALGAERKAASDIREFKNDIDDKFVNLHKGDVNALDNNFHKYINVAKQAARSNNADYLDRV